MTIIGKHFGHVWLLACWLAAVPSVQADEAGDRQTACWLKTVHCFLRLAHSEPCRAVSHSQFEERVGSCYFL